MVNDILIIRHVDSLIDCVGENALDSSISIVDSVVGILDYCFLVVIARLVEL